MTAEEHVYDGIHEHDNPLPRWWLFTLYAAMIFSAGYWCAFHTLGALPLPREELAAAEVRATEEREARERAAPVDDVTLLARAQDAQAVEHGRAIFNATCTSCHGQRAEGLVGPNLTDDAWLHGAAPKDIFATVNEGFLPKGMPPWGPVLGSSGVRDVVAYVLTLRGTHVAGKAAEGVVVKVAQ